MAAGALIHAVERHEHRIVAQVLARSGLSSAGLEEGGAYWIARIDGAVAGTVGLETTGSSGLLRSLAVLPEFRRTGVARSLVAHLLDEAQRLEVEDVYLFSKEAGSFFELLGWSEISVEAVATVLALAPQVRHYEQIGWYEDERAFSKTVPGAERRQPLGRPGPP